MKHVASKKRLHQAVWNLAKTLFLAKTLPAEVPKVGSARLRPHTLIGTDVVTGGEFGMMPTFASNFGGRYDLFLGCTALILIPFFGFAWIWLQLVSLWSGDRLSPLTLALVLSFSFVPGFFTLLVLKDANHLDGYFKFLFGVSLCGLSLLPVTVTREFLKYRRDRHYTRRKHRLSPRGMRVPTGIVPEPATNEPDGNEDPSIYHVREAEEFPPGTSKS